MHENYFKQYASLNIIWIFNLIYEMFQWCDIMACMMALLMIKKTSNMLQFINQTLVSNSYLIFK